jgi:hypothetical protein
MWPPTVLPLCACRIRSVTHGVALQSCWNLHPFFVSGDLASIQYPVVYSPRCYNVIIFVDFASVLSFCRELQGMNAGDEKVLLKGQITKQREQIILKAKAATAGWDAAAQSDERYCALRWLWWCSLCVSRCVVPYPLSLK